MHDEHFRRLMAVLRIDAAAGLPRRTDVEAVRLGDVDHLCRVLRHAGADDGEILLLVGARRARVDEGIAQALQVGVADKPPRHRVLGPLGHGAASFVSTARE